MPLGYTVEGYGTKGTNSKNFCRYQASREGPLFMWTQLLLQPLRGGG